MKILLALGAAAVALTVATPAAAKHRSHAVVCTKWHHGHCTRYKEKSRHHARYRVGYRFDRGYAYTPYGRIPRTYVSRYDLSPRYRYVYTDDYIYVIDPKTYAVQRVIDALIR